MRAKVLSELVCLECGRHEYDFGGQILKTFDFSHKQNEIGVYFTLVHFVKDDMRVLFEKHFIGIVSDHLLKENTCRHVQYACVFVHVCAIQTDLVAAYGGHLPATFIADSSGDTRRGDTSRLGYYDVTIS
jgi:hypothetical protein